MKREKSLRHDVGAFVDAYTVSLIHSLSHMKREKSPRNDVSAFVNAYSEISGQTDYLEKQVGKERERPLSVSNGNGVGC